MGQKRYKFFEQEIFGLDRAVEKLVEEYFHSAARRLDVRKADFAADGSRQWREIYDCHDAEAGAGTVLTYRRKVPFMRLKDVRCMRNRCILFQLELRPEVEKSLAFVSKAIFAHPARCG